MGKVKKLANAISLTNIKSVLRYIKTRGFKGLWNTCINKLRFGKVVLDEYATWIANNEPNAEGLQKQKEFVSCQNIKFVVAVSEKNEELEESLKEQTYTNFEVQSLKEKSIKEIVDQTKSDYVLILGKGIKLPPFCLYELVKSIESKDSILIYSDNDKIVEEKRTHPHFKPDFGRETITSWNYIGKLIAVKTTFLKAHEEVFEKLGENMIYDLIFRISEKTRKIEHISKVLYHEIKETKVNEEDEIKIIEKHLKRVNLPYNSVKRGKYKGQYKVDYKIKGKPLVSLVVPNKDLIEDLEKLINSLNKSTYTNYEVVIVENNSQKEETFNYYEKIQKENKKIRVEKFDIDYFNYSAIVNFGVEKAKGEYVVLLNNDIEFLSKNWIEELLMYAQRPDVGICGAKLMFPDRSIQHAGVTIGTRGLAGHRCREIEEKDLRPDDYINIVQNLSAVTAACFMIKKELFIELLGLDEKLAVAFNDIDFCLKVRSAKYAIIYNPFIEAYHYESKSRGLDDTEKKQKRFAKEYEIFVKRWAKVIGKGDPYYNKNYRLDTDLPKINYNKIA